MSERFKLISETGVEFDLNTPTYIGTHPNCQVRLTDSGIAPYHATLWIDQGRVIVRDENTQTGTMINHFRIVQPSYLNPGDHIRVGNNTLVLHKIVSPSVTDKKPRKTANNKKLWVILPAVILLFAIFAIVLGAVGFRNYQTLPRVFEGISQRQLNSQLPGLSTDQINLLQQMGRYPDAFVILFYEELSTGNNSMTIRQETWSYFPENQEYSFFNGDQTSVAVIGQPVSNLHSPAYRPEFFTAFMSLNDVIAVTKIDRYALIPMESELVPGAELYYADQLIFGLKEGQLLYVESLAVDQNPADSN
jgi:pSer/pThr/pTyr-binding forkhead associated (FHA) protein